MRALFVLLVPAFAAGCNSEPSVTATNASVAEVHDKVAAAGGNMGMRPGRWEGTVTVRNANAPAAPADSNRGVLNSQLLRVCVTPEQAKPGANPFVARLQAGCKYENFKLADGRLDAAMTCRQQGVTLKTRMTGEFSADTYKLSNVTEASGQAAGAMAGVKSDTTIEARRTGECRGDEGQ